MIVHEGYFVSLIQHRRATKPNEGTTLGAIQEKTDNSRPRKGRGREGETSKDVANDVDERNCELALKKVGCSRRSNRRKNSRGNS